MEMIVEAGVNLVDLEDGGRVYNKDALDGDGMAFLIMVIRFMRANQESVLKAGRLRAVYDSKRKTAAAGGKQMKPFTRQLPAWIYWDEEAHEHRAHTDRAATVATIFEKAVAGWGQHKIAHWLNEQGVQPWGHGKQKAAYWHRSYIKKILGNPAVVGTFTPHRRDTDATTGKRKRTPLAAIAGHFPAVVDKTLFDDVALRLAITAPRGRHANRETQSMFSGVLKCARCGGTVSRVSKGEHVYLVCATANAKAGTCRYQAVRYADLEAIFRTQVGDIVAQAPRGKDTEELECEIRNQGGTLDALEDAARESVDELRTNRSEAVRRRLREIELQIEHAEEQIRTLTARRDTRTSVSVQRKLDALRDALAQEPFSVVEANAALKQAVGKIVMDLEHSNLEIHWHHVDPETVPQEIPFFSNPSYSPKIA